MPSATSKYHRKPDNAGVGIALRSHLLIEQRYLCPLCHTEFPTDPHHTFLKQSDAPPKRRDELVSLFNNLSNLVMLCRECHDRYGQTTQVEIDLAAHKTRLGYDLKPYFLLIEDHFPLWSSSAWDKAKKEVIPS